MNMNTGSLMKWLLFCSCGLHVIQGQASTCINVKCDSLNYNKQDCEMEEAKQIINVSVSTKQSKTDCIYENGSANYAEQPGSGRYGFRGNILWVDRGCRAIFKVCYTDKETTQSTTKSSSMTHPVTTLPTDPPMSSENTDSPPLTDFLTSTEALITTNTKQQLITTESLESHEQEASSLPIPAIVIPVIVVLSGLTLIGVFLLKKRRSKTVESGQECCDSKQISVNRSSNSANSNTYSVLNEPSENNISATDAYSVLDAPQRIDNNYIVLGPEHSYASIDPGLKSDKKLENTTQAEKEVSPTSTVTRAAEYFILEPNNSYSDIENDKHSQDRVTPDKSLNQPCLLSEESQYPEKETNNLVNTQNRDPNMEYHNYFTLETHGLESPLELTEDSNDTNTAYTGQDISNFVNPHSYFVLEPSASYSMIDSKDVVIQTLPDNVYNTTHIKLKEVVQDPNYDTLNSNPQKDIENNKNEYSHTQKRSKLDHDTIDYSHINIMRHNDPCNGQNMRKMRRNTKIL